MVRSGLSREALAVAGVRRIVVAFGALTLAEWVLGTAVAISAYRLGGPLAVGLVGFRFVPAAMAGLGTALLGERHPRERVLVAIALARARAVDGPRRHRKPAHPGNGSVRLRPADGRRRCWDARRDRLDDGSGGRIGEARPLAAGLALSSLAIAAVGVVAAPGPALALLVVWGFGMSIADVSAQALLNRVAASAQLPRVVGLMESVKLLAEGAGACSPQP